MARPQTRRKGLRVYGVDFSSAPTSKKPIAVAVGHFEWGGDEPMTLTLERFDWLVSLAEFEEFLQRPGPWLGGFDLPFGQPRELANHYNWPLNWSDFVEFFTHEPRESLRMAFRDWCAGRPVGSKFAWRQADKPAGSSPAMRWTNPPVAWMMQAGIGRMKAAGLVFPAHHHPPQAWSAPGRLADHQTLARLALEAYPGFSARQVTRQSYKSDEPGRQTLERLRARESILRGLLEGRAGLSCRLIAPPALQSIMLADAKGDALDSAICALQACHAAVLPGFGLPLSLDPFEGWIAGVPPHL